MLYKSTSNLYAEAFSVNDEAVEKKAEKIPDHNQKSIFLDNC